MEAFQNLRPRRRSIVSTSIFSRGKGGKGWHESTPVLPWGARSCFVFLFSTFHVFVLWGGQRCHKRPIGGDPEMGALKRRTGSLYRAPERVLHNPKNKMIAGRVEGKGAPTIIRQRTRGATRAAGGRVHVIVQESVVYPEGERPLRLGFGAINPLVQGDRSPHTQSPRPCPSFRRCRWGRRGHGWVLQACYTPPGSTRYFQSGRDGNAVEWIVYMY